ncbi:unnamed protein product [Lactuca virosa]|uniref:Uncharacterized protein n=1 Tax=Lactuca virosa TaxID=75947 RepID=A0AAU9PCF6_9ASTR|nr:unnamed protein product [Lactuca virosa]
MCLKQGEDVIATWWIWMEGIVPAGRVQTTRTVRCRKCFEYGYNQKGCKNATMEPVPMPPKKKGRSRKEQCEPTQASGDMPERQEPILKPPKKR